MTASKRFYITTAIDYPNSLPHVGTAFEKLGADVQARYRRMEGYNVFLLMGNDENTVKVPARAQELGMEPKAYCDDMAAQFEAAWAALDISNNAFIQTSDEYHHRGCQKFIQKVYDAGYIRKGVYGGWYCNGCESFKTEKDIVEGICPIHKTPVIRREEECHYFELSKFRDWLLSYYEDHPDFIQPESRRNEILSVVKEELLDINITRSNQTWGIQVPFDPDYTIYVWFDALLNYITGIGYGTDEDRFNQWWPADIHVIGKDITRFHCALWPAMLHAAGLPIPKHVFGHGFITVEGQKMSKTLGNVVNPLDVLTKFQVSSDVFRYFFMRECSFPGDGDYSEKRFMEVNDSELANNYGNLYSRIVTLVTGNFDRVLTGTAGMVPGAVLDNIDLATLIREIQTHIESFEYSRALEKIVQKILTPANGYIEAHAPWKLVKTDKEAAKVVLFDLVEPLRIATILLKPFLPKGTETVYRGINFAQSWDSIAYHNAITPCEWTEDLRIMADLDDKGKVKPLYRRLQSK